MPAQAAGCYRPLSSNVIGVVMKEDTINHHWSSASSTHVGMVRQLNEDACMEMAWRGLWAVADGMGGHAAGDFASQSVVEGLREISDHGDLDSLVADTERALQSVNSMLVQEASRRREQIIGSTVAVLAVFGESCACVWAGDSRIYRFRNSTLTQLTQDHSQVEELISRGLITREEAEKLPGSNAITRAVGVTEHLELDSVLCDVHAGDIFLLCSDGLYNEVNNADIGNILALGDCRESAEKLVQNALDHGARDNVSVVVVRADDDGQITKTVLNQSVELFNESGEDETVFNK